MMGSWCYKNRWEEACHGHWKCIQITLFFLYHEGDSTTKRLSAAAARGLGEVAAQVTKQSASRACRCRHFYSNQRLSIQRYDECPEYSPLHGTEMGAIVCFGSGIV